MTTNEGTKALIEKARLTLLALKTERMSDRSVSWDARMAAEEVIGQLADRLAALTTAQEASDEDRTALESGVTTKVEMIEPVFALRGGAYLIDEHAGVMIDSAGNYSAKTRGGPAALAILLESIAEDVREAAALDGAPEPEWEWMSRAYFAELDRTLDSPITDEETARAMNRSTTESNPGMTAKLMRRRKAGPWEPVEGEKP